LGVQGLAVHYRIAGGRPGGAVVTDRVVVPGVLSAVHEVTIVVVEDADKVVAHSTVDGVGVVAIVASDGVSCGVSEDCIVTGTAVDHLIDDVTLPVYSARAGRVSDLGRAQVRGEVDRQARTGISDEVDPIAGIRVINGVLAPVVAREDVGVDPFAAVARIVARAGLDIV
jgi:hypothetical protein